MKAIGVLTYILALPLVCSSARAGLADSSRATPEGLFVAVTFLPGITFSDGRSGFAGEAGVAVGYRIGSSVEPWMAFLTGHHHLPVGGTPVSEDMAYGGFALGMNAHVNSYASVHPLLSVILTAGTLLDDTGAGYNQAGLRIGAGGWFGLTRKLALTAQLFYGRNYRTRWIGDVSSRSGGMSQSTGSAGVALTFAFSPQISP